jgi:hypothetical protein
MKEAYPTFVNDISLDWGTNSNLMKIIVGFSFKEWYFKNIQSTASFIAPVNNSVFRLENFVLPETIASQFRTAVVDGVNGLRSIITPSPPPSINNLPFGYVNPQNSVQPQRQ